MPERGKYFVLEGGEGCGKTWQAKELYDYLTRCGIDCIHTREPGGTTSAESIRRLILDPGADFSMESRFFLFEASRAEIFRKVIVPSLNEGKSILSDRSGYSTLAYQGYGSGIDLNLIRKSNELAMQGISPDLLVIIDISAEKGLEKLTTKEFGKRDAFESQLLDFHKRVNYGFLKIAEENPGISVVVPYVENGQEEMQREIRKYVLEKLARVKV